jgi:riboflavin kinase/FMN adenylyltransferase
VEAHIFDFDGDLYGQEVAVALHVFIRAEQKFASFDALKIQIAQDADEARGFFRDRT